MAYQGTYDLAEMAKDLSETILAGGNWSVAIAHIGLLNPLQTLYVLNIIVQNEYLDKEDINRLAMIAESSMNDGEYGNGYISDSQGSEE